MGGGQDGAGSGFPVLVVEDDGPTRALLEREIADAGHPVRAVGDGRAALEAMLEQASPIVLSDIRLPGGMDGVRLCDSVRTTHPDTEVILVTAFASVATAIEGLKLGACDYLVKPFDDIADVRRSIAKASARVAQRLAERQVVSGLRARSEGQAALLDRLPIAIVVVDSDARVHATNRAADAVLQGDLGLSVEAGGLLRAPHAEDSRALRSAIATCCALPAADPAAVAIASGPGKELRAAVAPLLPGVLGGDARHPLAAVMLHDPRRKASLHREILCCLYGLTHAEASFAARIVAGDSVQEACDALGIALATGRTHLSRIFRKTNTSRQGDLVGLVLSGPALLAAGVSRSDSRPG